MKIEQSVAPPRQIPVPDSPPPSAQLPPDSSAEDAGSASASFDRECAPPQSPTTDFANCHQLASGQFYELRNQRGYHKKDTRAALRTCSADMDAANRKNTDGCSRDMGTLTSVLGERTRTMGKTMGPGAAVGGSCEKRTRSDALEIASAAFSKVPKEHAQ